MKVFIATPCYGGIVTDGYLNSVVRLFAPYAWSNPAVQFGLQTLPGDSLISSARNRLARSFLKSPCDAVLWIDADIAFAQRDVDLLLAADKPLIGGVYPYKRLVNGSTEHVVGGLHGDREGDLQRAGGVGLGFTLIRREVFERMADSVETYRDDEGALRDYFPTEIIDGQLYGEDYAFCRRWRRLDGEVWAHLGVNLGHIGQHTFRGDPAAHKGQ